MTRLPQPGGDNNIWGDLLNDFLNVEHNSDGTLKNVARPADLIPKLDKSGGTMTGSLTLAGDPSSALQAATKQYVDGVAVSGAPDATTTTKGIVQLAGDLAGTAAAPTVPGLSGKEPTIAAGTNSQYYRGDKTWQTLDKTAVGLSNVDNTSDLNKPISTATQNALNTKLTASNNLSDLANAGTARTNLGLGTAATHPTTDFDAAGAATTAETNAKNYTDSKFPVAAVDTTYDNSTSGLTAANVQAAIDELKTDVDAVGGGGGGGGGSSSGVAAFAAIDTDTSIWSVVPNIINWDPTSIQGGPAYFGDSSFEALDLVTTDHALTWGSPSNTQLNVGTEGVVPPTYLVHVEVTATLYDPSTSAVSNLYDGKYVGIYIDGGAGWTKYIQAVIDGGEFEIRNQVTIPVPSSAIQASNVNVPFDHASFEVRIAFDTNTNNSDFLKPGATDVQIQFNGSAYITMPLQGGSGSSSSSKILIVDHADSSGGMDQSPPSGAGTNLYDSFTDGERYLLTRQPNGKDNGIWIANNSGPWTRPDDWKTGDTIVEGTLIQVKNSAGYNDAIFKVLTPSSVVDTDSISIYPIVFPGTSTFVFDDQDTQLYIPEIGPNAVWYKGAFSEGNVPVSDFGSFSGYMYRDENHSIRVGFEQTPDPFVLGRSMIWAGTWNNTNTYNKGSIVTGSDGAMYGSLVDSNVGNNPVTDGGVNWTKAPSGGGSSGIGTKLVYQTFTHVLASSSSQFGNLSWADPSEKLFDDGSGDVVYDSGSPGNFTVNTPGIYSAQIYMFVSSLTNQNALIQADYNFAGQGWNIREGYGQGSPGPSATGAECTAILPPTYFDVTNKNSFACEYFIRDTAASWYIEESTVIITRVT
ncbi:MAG TPA: hypothetical protein VHB51_00650 [Candidatus Saccharimonadales bacterium]|nr:hypothetical protein [Candidatus Saccharimonadales bacterium]